MKNQISQTVTDFMAQITELCGSKHVHWAENFRASFANTLETTVKQQAISLFPLYEQVIAES